MYWMFRITKNTNDDWGTGISYIVFGNLRVTSFGADTTIWTDKLLSCGDIDQTVDIFDSPLAKISDFSFVIENSEGNIDPYNYIGRKVEVFCGYGATMSLATADLFFTGKIVEASTNKKDVEFSARSEIEDKEFGIKVSEDANEKYRGKMYPMIYGDQSDKDSYAPLVIDSKEKSSVYALTFERKELTSFNSLQLWDKNIMQGFGVTDTTQFTLAADKTKLFFSQQTTTIISVWGVSENDTTLYVSNAGLIDYRSSLKNYNFTVSGVSTIPEANQTYSNNSSIFRINQSNISGGNGTLYTTKISGTNDPSGNSLVKTSGGYGQTPITFSDFVISSTEPSACLLQIDNEIMLVLRQPVDNKIFVERGYLNTKKTTHGYQAQIYQLNTDVSTLLIKLSHRFFPFEFSNFTENGYSIKNIKGKIDYLKQNIIDYSSSHSIYFDGAFGVSGKYGVLSFDLIFDKLDIEGDIDNLYLLCKANSLDDPRAAGTTVTASIYILKDRIGLPLTIVSTSHTYPANGQDSFNNLFPTVVESETALELTGLFKINNVNEFSSNCYTIYFTGSLVGGTGVGFYDNTLWGIGFRADFKVSPLKYDFYFRGQGRKNPGSYYTGASGDLMENPTTILEDFLRQEISLGNADIDEDSFVVMETARTDWKLAFTIFDDMPQVEGI